MSSTRKLPMLLEVACFSLDAVKVVAGSDADRIEYCFDYASGGVTPPIADIVKIRQITEKPLFVMIRPRAGDFEYNNEEIKNMHGLIKEFKAAGADGFVFGITDFNNELNMEENHRLISMAYPLPCTLHRAFDMVPDKHKSLEQAIDCGFSRILTSGGVGNAVDNIGILARLVTKASGRINIIPGGGLRSSNIDIVINSCGAKEYHSACITNTGTLLPDPREINLIKAKL